ncbi:MAG: hypothetical protein IPP64_15380 [Bacteroidetes bacterium]|nr:hypothetical protein [Bacteroidota bacterium]
MGKRFFTLSLFIIIPFSISSQVSENKIDISDFHHFSDCQKIIHRKSKFGTGDTSFVDISYQFDKEGNLARKYKGFPFYGGESQKLTVYSYGEKNALIQKITYDTTYLKNAFRSFDSRYYYNGKKHPDSLVNIISYPYLNYLPVTEKSIVENLKEFDEPILVPWDSSDTSQQLGMVEADGEIKSVTGYAKVKKEVVLQGWAVYTAALFKYSYNSKNKLIKEELPKLIENEFSGSSVFIYDKKNRISEELFNYNQEGRLHKLDPKEDSIDKWIQNHYTTYFEYGADNVVTETAASTYRIFKFICYRNKKGQIIKTICSAMAIENKYIDGKFIPTDTLSISSKDFQENICLYEYDSLGRIIKCVDHYSTSGNRKHVSTTTYKYKDNRPLILPENEYVDFEIWNHEFLMGQEKFRWF